MTPGLGDLQHSLKEHKSPAVEWSRVKSDGLERIRSERCGHAIPQSNKGSTFVAETKCAPCSEECDTTTGKSLEVSIFECNSVEELTRYAE